MGLGVVVVASVAILGRELWGPRGLGMFSANLRAVKWRPIGWGLILQIALALLILQREVHGLDWD